MENNSPNGFKKIFLCGERGKDLCALVSSRDYDVVARYKWYLSSGGYAIARGNIYMHRLIMNAPRNMQVDHMNHDRLDNRRSNLRICTVKENQQNRILSRYRWCARLNRWEVRLKKDGKWTKRYFREEADALDAVKKIRSGVEPNYNKKSRNKYLPKYISKYVVKGGLHRYYFRCRFGGKIYTKGGFTTIKEATIFRDSFFKNI